MQSLYPIFILVTPIDRTRTDLSCGVFNVHIGATGAEKTRNINKNFDLPNIMFCTLSRYSGRKNTLLRPECVNTRAGAGLSHRRPAYYPSAAVIFVYPIVCLFSN